MFWGDGVFALSSMSVYRNIQALPMSVHGGGATGIVSTGGKEPGFDGLGGGGMKSAISRHNPELYQFGEFVDDRILLSVVF